MTRISGLPNLLLLSAFSSVGNGIPTNTPVKYPDVIPGPGMPSLESLGLTSTMLYEMSLPRQINATKDIMKRSVDCVNGPERYYTNDGAACYNYLNNLGSTQCGLYGQGNSIEFVYAGSAAVVGTNVGPNFYEASDCSDVAIGVLYALEDCYVGSGFDNQGIDVANGNGYLQVATGHS